LQLSSILSIAVRKLPLGNMPVTVIHLPGATRMVRVNLPEIYARNPPVVHSVDLAKTSVSIPLLQLEDAKL
jgi:hypothetical protein